MQNIGTAKPSLQKFIDPFFCLVFTVLLATHCKGSDVVYGVRWALGDRYAYDLVRSNSPNKNYYILSFNTESIMEEDIYAEISGSIYTCSGRHIEVKNVDKQESQMHPFPNSSANENVTTETVIYRCYINTGLKRKSNGQQIPYKIYKSSPIFMHKFKSDHQANSSDSSKHKIIDRQVKSDVEILFSGSFRPPPLPKQKTDFQFVTVGDWAPEDPSQYNSSFHPILPPILAKIEQNPQISLFTFLGDLAYDFLGEKYKAMLKLMEPVTSRICFMPAPGNHDYIYHQDAFELFAQTFLSPQWDSYYNFYYSFLIGEVLFIQYTPENLLFKQGYLINVNPITYLKQIFDKKAISEIKDKYSLVVYTHYPVFCSSEDATQSCLENEDRLKSYLSLFTEMGLDLYMSGHLHYYERTNGVCWGSNYTTTMQKPQSNDDDLGSIYSEKCPIYVVEGGGGNSFMNSFPETANKYNAAHSSGTGFGIVSIQESSQSILYEHHQTTGGNSTKIGDKFVKKLSNDDSSNSGSQSKHWIKALALCVVLMALGFISWMLFKKKKFMQHQNSQNKFSSQNGKDHVEINEQNLGTAGDSDRDSKAQKKQLH